METQANAPAPAQVQTPVHPIHQEAADLALFTKIVQDTPDNDPDHPEDSSSPRPAEAPPAQEGEQQAQDGQEQQQETGGEEVEIDEETPFFELEYNGEVKKLSAKELREGYLAKQDYHRNIQKVKAEEAKLQEKVREETLKAQNEYLQKLEIYKQSVSRLSGVKSLQEIEQMAADDPAGAQKEFLKLISVNQTVQAVEQEQQQAFQKLEVERKNAIEQAKLKSREILETEIKGWNRDLYSSVLEAMVNDYGFRGEEVDPVVDHRLIKVFHDAYKYRALQKANPEVRKKVVAIPKVIKPGSAEKPNPAKDAEAQSFNRLKKSGRGEDFVDWYVNKNKKG